MTIIDPHLHLFDLNKGHYYWLRSDVPPFWSDKDKITRNFSEQDLALADHQLAGFVHIEAGFDNDNPCREIDWLESTCLLPFRSIAGIDLTLPKAEFLSLVNHLTKYKSVVGVRHILDEQTEIILGSPNALINLQCLANQGLLFELQADFGDEAAVECLVRVFGSPQNSAFGPLKVIINHAGFPPLCTQTASSWRNVIQRLSQNPNVFIKCSGWEMTDRDYSLEWVNEIVKQVITLFGDHRVMLASNFPLCTFSRSYEDYWSAASKFLDLTLEQKKALFHDNAFSIYGF
jgi:L-fuconolactonase